MTKNVKLIGIPENNFLCIFINSLSPGVHTFFCLWRLNKVNQLKVQNIHVHMDIYPPLKKKQQQQQQHINKISHYVNGDKCNLKDNATNYTVIFQYV